MNGFEKNFIFSFLGIFVAMDIIGILPLYLGMTKTVPAHEKKKNLRLSILVAFSVALFFLLLGKWVFKALGIAVFDFKVGGGIVLLVMSILDLIKNSADQKPILSSGVVPLALPLITGPALITTIMLQVSMYGSIVVIISLMMNFAFAWIAFQKSSVITHVIGDQGTDVFSKISALFMTAIAFSMIRTGIFESLHLNN